MKCRRCDSENVRASRRKWSDTVYTLFGRNAWRCHVCNCRFHASSNESPTSTHRHSSRSRKHSWRPAPRTKRLLQEAAIAIVGILLFLFFLRYLTHESTPSGEGALLFKGRIVAHGRAKEA